MNLEIQKNKYYEIDGISNILNHISKINNYKIKEGILSISIDIDLSYKDISAKEYFKSITFVCDVSVDGIEILQIDLVKTSLYVIEGNGIDIEYMLNMAFETKELDKNIIEIEAPAIEEEIELEDINIVENNELEQETKEEISKKYTDDLQNAINERSSIIKTVSNVSEDTFINIFDTKNYYRLKTLECKSNIELDEISKMYNIPYQELIAGYDKENGRVIFKLKG